MKYMAHVVPATGTPIARGDIASVLATVTRFLDTHPAYTVAVRPTEGKPRHSIRLRHTPDGYKLTVVEGGTYEAHAREVQRDLDEITTVLRNLGAPITQEQAHDQDHAEPGPR